MAFLEGPVNFHMGSCSQQPLVRTYEEDTERQETTNEYRSCLCGLTHTRPYSLCMLALPSGEVVQCPRTVDTAVHAALATNHVTLASPLIDPSL